MRLFALMESSVGLISWLCVYWSYTHSNFSIGFYISKRWDEKRRTSTYFSLKGSPLSLSHQNTARHGGSYSPEALCPVGGFRCSPRREFPSGAAG